MAIWKQDVKEGQTFAIPEKTMGALIGLQVTEIGNDFLRGTLDVDHRTVQHLGMLHGGASCAMAEELGSIAANLCLDPAKAFGVGIEINANHLRRVTQGRITGTARPLQVGRSIQVWEIRIEDDAGQLVCVSRLTVAVVQKNGRKV